MRKTRVGRQTRGFTLIEMLISLALFSIVVLVAVGALLSLVGANKKAQALEDVMNNLNISIDDIVRNARQGTEFNGHLTFNDLPTCSSNSGGPSDCSGGGTAFEFLPYNNGTNEWIFQFVCPVALVNGVCPSGGYIEKSTDSGLTWSVITSSDINIASMEFYVVGTTRGDTVQPKVVIVIEGKAGSDVYADTSFQIEATAVQRVLDL